MIVVTGGAGFIGGHVVRSLAGSGEEVGVVDVLDHDGKLRNIASAPIEDLIAPDRFLDLVRSGSSLLDDVTAVVHQGACTATTHPDGRYVMDNNHHYSSCLARWCLDRSVPFLYASSASVYGTSASCAEEPCNEHPRSVYALSKLLTDRLVRRLLPTAGSQLVGLRYFNVYGTGEDHKGDMRSIVAQLDDEVRRRGVATVFGASHGFGPGEQRRDFVAVEDVVSVVRWFLERPQVSGVFNVGTGRSRTFREVAETVIASRGTGELRFKEFPPELVDHYQPATEADLTRLRSVGYAAPFVDVEEGIPRYLESRG